MIQSLRQMHNQRFIIYLLLRHCMQLTKGQKKTKEMLERDFYWKNMRKYVQKFVEFCPSCQIQKTKGPPELQRTPIPTPVWGRISLDLVGPLNRTRQDNRYILTCVDFLTKYPECIPLPDIKAETVARALVENIITRHGAPRKLLTDCGKQFIGHLFTNIGKELGIQKLRTTLYHPATNGILERFHKTLKTTISHFVSNFMENRDKILPYALMAYRNQPHETTKESPFFFMFGRDRKLPIHLTIKDHVLRYDLDEN